MKNYHHTRNADLPIYLTHYCLKLTLTVKMALTAMLLHWDIPIILAAIYLEMMTLSLQTLYPS